jgi:hypothetical protein
MGFDEARRPRAIRVSLGPETTEAEVRAFAEAWGAAHDRFRSPRGVPAPVRGRETGPGAQAPPKRKRCGTRVHGAAQTGRVIRRHGGFDDRT